MSVYIIAEAGVNHNGDIELAKKMIQEAKRAGVDAIKFQSFKTEELTTKRTPLAPYQEDGTIADQSELLKSLELSEKATKELVLYAHQLDINMLSSPFDLSSVRFLGELKLSPIKIPSGEITNLPYLREVAKLKTKVILSTGMSTLGEIQNALEILDRFGAREVALLHCNSEYPTPMKDVNLSAMITLREMFAREVGYSDHTLGIEVPIAAVALGAKIIEKHFTLDKELKGPDHKASLDPKELRAMVSAIRNIEKALGDGLKAPTESEAKNIKAVRKSIVAKRVIKKGEVFTEENLAVKRPATGLSPMLWDEVIGKTAKKNFQEDEEITL
ncbi:N-acetylneuraminate synthase [Guggenheimella bovis]